MHSPLRVALRLSQELRMELVRRRQVAQLAEEGDVIVTYDSICRPFLDKCRMLLRFDPLCEPGTPRSPSTSGGQFAVAFRDPNSCDLFSSRWL